MFKFTAWEEQLFYLGASKVWRSTAAKLFNDDIVLVA